MAVGRIIGIIFYICVLFAGVSSIINLYEAPVAYLQEQFNFSRPIATTTIHVIGCIVAIFIQAIVGGWMDVVSIYICPLGAALAGIMFLWVAGKDYVIPAVSQGHRKEIGGWYYPLAKYVYVTAAIIALIAGAKFGGIGW